MASNFEKSLRRTWFNNRQRCPSHIRWDGIRKERVATEDMARAGFGLPLTGKMFQYPVYARTVPVILSIFFLDIRIVYIHFFSDSPHSPAQIYTMWLLFLLVLWSKCRISSYACHA